MKLSLLNGIIDLWFLLCSSLKTAENLETLATIPVNRLLLETGDILSNLVENDWDIR